MTAGVVLPLFFLGVFVLLELFMDRSDGGKARVTQFKEWWRRYNGN